ncbi:hypothetical protein EH223_20425 [candidate division KSB1 bacterium]|nr:hypothetical protein [candidate division KSB1 bacterium]RQV99869.1 MAG: hypothetical protein EH223_20425 [candidate division KSB1 bacterium]
MPRLCTFFYCLIFLSALKSQSVDDSSKVILDSDSTVVDSTALRAPVDSVHIDEPLYDFRSAPDIYLRGFYHDSTLIIGSRYVSFGDVFDWMPGGYFYNMGGAGQLAYGSMFGAPAGEMILEYDGLVLNNPFTGLADFNLIPTESMGHAGLVHSFFKPCGYMPIGASFHFQSRTIANNPIRSQVGYRTGYYQYDDVDVRLGIQASKKLWIDAGGVIRSWGGLTSNEAYSGTKVNAKLNRRFGSHWLARYILLFNLRDTEIPLPDQLRDLQDFLDPKQKDGRIDHALIIHYKKKFSTIVQYTKFESELRAADKSVFFEQHNAHMIRGTSELNLFLREIRWRNGLHAMATFAESTSWGKRRDWQADAYSSLHGRINSTLHWYAAVKMEKNEDYAPQIVPEAQLFYAIDSTAAVSVWANQVVRYPSMTARYAIGPFAYGNGNLTFSRYNQIGLAGEKQFVNLFLHAAGALMQRKNQIATYDLDDKPTFTNMPDLSTLTFDASLDYHFMPKWRLLLQGKLFSDFNADPVVTQRPSLYSKFFLQYHLIAFKGDLNARLRAGAFVLGERQGPVPFYADFSRTTVKLEPAIYPYFHAVLKYRTAEIFIAYENYIDADVQYVYGYSMPQLWFRYGFIWHFVD